MKKTLFPESAETAQETALRAILQEHAPDSIELERAWTAVRGRLPVAGQVAAKTSGLRLFSAGDARRRWRKTPVLVALAVFAFVLMGAASGIYFWGGPFGDPGIQLIGDQHLYSDIGQKLQIEQVTITVTKAYADMGRTLIAYDVQIPANLSNKYGNVVILSYSVKDQSGEEPDGTYTECTAMPKDGSPMHCLMTLTAFHPGPSISQLVITWEIDKIALMPPTSASAEIHTGDWRFQFSLPFHRVNHGSSGPDAQPTRNS